MKVKEKVVVVTGGASGIGRALAERFAAEEARTVVVADVDEEGARAVADSIGTAAFPAGVDVTDEARSSRSSTTSRTAVAPSTSSAPTPASSSARAWRPPTSAGTASST